LGCLGGVNLPAMWQPPAPVSQYKGANKNKNQNAPPSKVPDGYKQDQEER